MILKRAAPNPKPAVANNSDIDLDLLRVGVLCPSCIDGQTAILHVTPEALLSASRGLLTFRCPKHRQLAQISWAKAVHLGQFRLK